MPEIIHKQGQKAPCSISQDKWTYTWTMYASMYQPRSTRYWPNVFTTARFNMCIDAMKKNSNALTLELVTRSISK